MKNILSSLICIILVGCAVVEGVNSRKFYMYGPKSTDGMVVSEASDECWLEIFGEINPGMINAFNLASNDFKQRKCSTKWVLLNSPGGDIASALQIGESIRKQGFNTALKNEGGSCASACTILFIGGVQRALDDSSLVSTRLAFHQISRRDSTNQKICVPMNSQVYKNVSRYAETMIPSAGAQLFLSLTQETDCNKLTPYTYSQLKGTGIITTGSGIKTRLF
jgi:hypothetical protein